MAKNKDKTCDNCSFKHTTHEHCRHGEFINPIPEARICDSWIIKEEAAK
jgi:hypothetical protein